MPSSEKKWRPSAVRGEFPAGPFAWTVSVTPFASRAALAVHDGSATGSWARTARIRLPNEESGFGSSAETGRASETLALPGTHSSSHMSQSALAESSAVAPAFRSAGGVIVTGSSRSPS